MITCWILWIPVSAAEADARFGEGAGRTAGDPDQAIANEPSTTIEMDTPAKRDTARRPRIIPNPQIEAKAATPPAPKG